MTIEELKNELGTTLKAFKDENEKRLKEVENLGAAQATTVQNVENLNGRIDEIKDSINTLSKNLGNQLDALAVNGGNRSDPKAAEARTVYAKMLSARTGKQVTPEHVEAYQNAFGQFLRNGETPEIRAAMSVGYEQGGGLLVGPAIESRIVSKLYETSPMRQIAFIQPISTSDGIKGIVDNDEASSGWTSERASRTETNTPELGKYEIAVHEQYAEPRITQQLLDDAAVDPEAWLAGKVADKLIRTENTAFVTGNGSGKPRGFLDYDKATTADSTRAWNVLQYVASGSSGAFAASAPFDKVFDLVFAVKNQYRANAVFAGNRTTLAAIRKLKDGQSNYLIKVENGAVVETIAGYRFVEMADMPDIAADAYSLAFGDFRSAYTIVDRAGISVLRDPYTAKPYVKFYTTKRVGGGLVNGEAVKLMKFAAS